MRRRTRKRMRRSARSVYPASPPPRWRRSAAISMHNAHLAPRSSALRPPLPAPERRGGAAERHGGQETGAECQAKTHAPTGPPPVRRTGAVSGPTVDRSGSRTEPGPADRIQPPKCPFAVARILSVRACAREPATAGPLARCGPQHLMWAGSCRRPSLSAMHPRCPVPGARFQPCVRPFVLSVVAYRTYV